MRNKLGIGVIEVLVSSAILGVIFVTYMKTSTNISNSRKTAEDSHRMKEFALEVAKKLKNPENCAASLQPANLSSSILSSNPTIAAVRDNGNNIIYGVGTNYLNGSVRLNALSITAYTAPTTVEMIAGFAVSIEIGNMRPAPGSPDQVTILTPINVRIDGAGAPLVPITCFVGVEAEYVLKTGDDMTGALIIDFPPALVPPRGLRVTNGFIQTSEFFIDSDEQLKTRIRPIHDPLLRLAALNGYDFKWNSSKQKDMGLVAQEVRTQMPELVTKADNNESLAVKYLSFMGPQVEAIRQLHSQQILTSTQIEALEEKLNKLLKKLKHRE